MLLFLEKLGFKPSDRVTVVSAQDESIAFEHTQPTKSPRNNPSMSERVFHLLVGLVLLAALCFDLKPASTAWLPGCFEVATNQRLTAIVSHYVS